MSITEELRDWMGASTHNTIGTELIMGSYNKLLAIADRIDEQHEHAVMSAMNDVLYHANDESMAELGWLRLPKDADGVPIRVGDVMEGVDKYDSLKKVIGKVITVSFEADGIIDVAVRAWNDDGKSWHRAYLDPDASLYRHHHEPTVEDVLREFAEKMNENMGMYTGEAIDADEWRDADRQTIAEYAAKLRLAEEAE